MEVDEDMPNNEGTSEQGYRNCTSALEAEKKRVCAQLIASQNENARLLLIVETLMNLLSSQIAHPGRQLQIQMLRLEVDSLKLEKEMLREELVAARNQVEMLNAWVDTPNR
ncbi:unnamed protein product [Allacma fusca]|uniref:Uncharacterized protein n=1 Tax=Allacma fusca TaxID=39272 RepID=A0A8J2PIN5_9HEXA|nr:unnamed protein product [Allacma fusca]